MKKNNLLIIYLLICFNSIIGCKDKKTKLEFYSKIRQDSVMCKIGYIFYKRNGIALDFYPCKSFNISDPYSNLVSDNLEEGFQQSWNTINYSDFLTIQNSADTFLYKYSNPKSIDTVLIVPAYFEYRIDPVYLNINQNVKITYNEYFVSFLNKTLRLKAYFRVYQIDKIIPLKSYKEKSYNNLKDTFIIR
jgi:hypothetical protein